MLDLTLGEKQVEKNLLSRLAFCKEKVAVMLLCSRFTEIRSLFGANL